MIYRVSSIVIVFIAGLCCIPFVEGEYVLPVIVTLLIALMPMPNVLRWLAGTLDLFNPVALTSVVGLVLFCVAPLGHMLGKSYYMPITGHVADQMLFLQALTAVSYAMFMVAHILSSQGMPRMLPDFLFRLNRGTWNVLAGIQFVASIPVIIYFQYRFGLLTGGMAWGNADIPLGIGVYLSFADAIVPVFFITLAVNLSRGRRVGGLKGYAILFLTTLLVVAYLGLRGSRGIMLTYLVWAVGIVHYRFIRIPRWLVLASLVFILPAFTAYRVYKDYGPKIIPDFLAGKFYQIQRQSGHTIESVLLGDVSRTDVIRFIVQEADHSGFPYQYGATYFLSLAGKVPRFVWLNKPMGLPEIVTDLEHGKGTYASLRKKSARIAGFIGESIINFGVFGVPFVFVVYGLFLGRYSRWTQHLPIDDDRHYILPMLTYIVSIIFWSDSENILTLLMYYASVPFLMVWFSGSKTHVDQADDTPEYEQWEPAYESHR